MRTVITPANAECHFKFAQTQLTTSFNAKQLHSCLKCVALVIALACCITCATAGETNVTHVNAQQAQKLIADKKVVVLDIRTPEEFAAGHIAGATNINFRAADFEKALAALDKNQTYVLHCASGNRST